MALERTLGLPGLIFYGTGVILGAGIWTVVGAAAGVAGGALWQSFLASAFVALLTGLSYAELATMWPKAGAEYVYLREAFPRRRLVAVVVGALMAASGAATAATVSIAFAGYFADFVSAPAGLVSAVALAAMVGLNVVGLQASSKVNALFTLIEVVGLLVVIGVAIGFGEWGEAFAEPPHLGVLGGAGLVFFSYLGFESIANLAEETRDAEKNLPRAILASLGIVTALYLAVALSALALEDPDALAASAAPIADAVRSISPGVAAALGGVALFSTANTALVNVLSASRIAFGMAEGGDLPRGLAETGRRKTPVRAVLVVSVLAFALLPLGKVEVVAGVASLLSLAAFALVNAAVIQLRQTEPDRERPFRVPLAIGGVPVLPALALPLLVALATQFEPTVYAIAGGVVALAAAMHAVRSRLAQR